MPTRTAAVNYKYRKIGTNAWTSTSRTVSGLNSESETMVMQKLRDTHKGCEIELTRITWR